MSAPGELVASMTETQRSVVEDLISTAMAAGAACIADRGRKGLVDMNAPLSDALGDYPMEFVSIRPSLLANVLEAFR
ncbi:hypothetical protein [Rhodococcoides fascians]|uniref:hypothetical protein n=1 Tax=Rhodococcoides fascians TaxID=1828 RepID=UPI0037BA9865